MFVKKKREKTTDFFFDFGLKISFCKVVKSINSMLRWFYQFESIIQFIIVVDSPLYDFCYVCEHGRGACMVILISIQPTPLTRPNFVIRHATGIIIYCSGGGGKPGESCYSYF